MFWRGLYGGGCMAGVGLDAAGARRRGARAAFGLGILSYCAEPVWQLLEPESAVVPSQATGVVIDCLVNLMVVVGRPLAAVLFWNGVALLLSFHQGKARPGLLQLLLIELLDAPANRTLHLARHLLRPLLHVEQHRVVYLVDFVVLLGQEGVN